MYDSLIVGMTPPEMVIWNAISSGVAGTGNKKNPKRWGRKLYQDNALADIHTVGKIKRTPKDGDGNSLKASILQL